jgi:glycerophosphoryl diester phosphodiesterase
MLDRVEFGGRIEDITSVIPGFKRPSTASWQPGMTKPDVAGLQDQGKFVIANFSANDHELDFPMMQRAVAAGVDVVNTDHPRLAADALGRSIEKRALALARKAHHGDLRTRLEAISELSRFRDLPLTAILTGLVWDAEPAVSRAACVALAQRRDAAALSDLLTTLARKPEPITGHSAANVAWLAGVSGSTNPDHVKTLVTLAGSSDPAVAMESLRALSVLTRPVPLELLNSRLGDPNALVRGAAARCLATRDRSSLPALEAGATRLELEIHELWSSYAAPPAKSADLGKARTTFERPDAKKPGAAAQIARAQELYRGYQNVLRAIASLHTPEADRWLDR